MQSFDLIYEVKKLSFRSVDVCVVLPNYNYADFVCEALESLINQSLRRFKVVVIDDCSTDQSLSTVQDFLQRHRKRFNQAVLLRTQRNIGPAMARNIGIKYLPAKFYFFLDTDNILFPRCLEIHRDALYHSDAQFAYATSSKFGDIDECLSYHPWDRKRLQRGNYIDMMSMIRGSWLEQIGYFSHNPATKFGWEDYDLWIKTALQNGMGVQIPQILSRYRVHQASRSKVVSPPNSALMDASLREKYPEFYDVLRK